MPPPDPTLTQPAAPTAPDTTVEPGDRYHLGDEIARGGMGAVFAARDTVLDRDVAVKVLHPRLAGTAAARRFVDEAHITGQLQHPGIPPVHDLGTLPDGRPFLAMKLIKGRTLDAVLKAGTDRGRLLAVFEDICQAVGYAHAHGIVHRDLKPANVMVGAFGEVQVMDWGLAKLLASRERERPEDDPQAARDAVTEVRGSRDPLDATRAGSVMGTPAYMPPEQAIGAVDQIDARSDVFGLGAILCALLTGKPPFVGDSAESTRQLAAKGKLSDAFARLDASGAEPGLVALGKRCLAAERDDRPRDAGEVAALVAGLRAAADDRARRVEVEAGQALVRAAVARKRRELAVFSGLALLGGTAGVTVGVVRADRDRWTAEAAKGQETVLRQTAEAALTTATAARDRTRQALDAMTSDITGDSLSAQKEVSPEQKRFLAEVLTYYREFAGERGDDETSRARTAKAAYRVGQIESRLGRAAEGAAALAQARDGFAGLAADFPTEPAYRRILARCQTGLGLLLADLGKRPEAEAAHRAARDVDEKLAADFPAVPDHLVAVALNHSNLGSLLSDMGKPAEAEAAHRATLALRAKLASDFPNVAYHRSELADSHSNLGDLLADAGKQAEAEGSYRAALALREKLAADFPVVAEYRVDLGSSYCKVGNHTHNGGKPFDSLGWFARAIATLQPIVAADPRQVWPKRYLRNSHWGRAEALDRLTRHAEAVADWNRAIELDDGSLRGYLRAGRATSWAQAGRVAEAIAEVADLTQSPEWKPHEWYDFACVYAVAGGKLADKRDEYATRAVELLGKAVTAGYTDAAHLAKDADLDPLRDRPDFRRLVADLTAATRSQEVAPPPRPVR